MKLTRTRAFKASALVAIGGIGSGVLGEASAAPWSGLDARKQAEPLPKEGTHSPIDSAGPVITHFDGIAMHDSTGIDPTKDTLEDVDARHREIELGPAGDDAPVAPLGPAGDSSVRSSKSVVAAAAKCGSWFDVRGGSLIPPYDGKTVYWDAPGAGYEVRRIIGAECLGENQNFSFGEADAFKVSDYNSTYGRRVVHRDGWNFEGCRLVVLPPFGVSQYECDFKTKDLHRLTPDTSGAFWRTRLKNWASQTAQNQGSCATTIIGTWVGSSTLADVGVACIDNGPINPATL